MLRSAARSFVPPAAQRPEERVDDPDQTEVPERRGGVKDAVSPPLPAKGSDERFHAVVEFAHEAAEHRRTLASAQEAAAAYAGQKTWKAQLRQSGEGFGRKSSEAHARSIAAHTARARWARPRID